MQVSRNLLTLINQSFTQINDQQFIDACNAIGIEVENIIHHPKTTNLIVGKIIDVTNHPNADKLHVCKVITNENETPRTIVCGADNVRANLKVIIANENTKMIDGRVIQYKPLRGIVSQGMICAYDELTNLTNFINSYDADTIIELDDSAIIGDTEVDKYIGIDDTIYDLSLPSNRNDLNGLLFLVQEISSYFKWDYQIKEPKSFEGAFKSSIALEFDPSISEGLYGVYLKNIATIQSS